MKGFCVYLVFALATCLLLDLASSHRLPLYGLKPVPVKSLPQTVFVTPKRDNDPSVRVFVQEVASLLAVYDGTPAWHQQFNWYTNLNEQSRVQSISEQLEFIRGKDVISVTYDWYSSDSGKYWACEIVFTPEADGWPVKLDMTFTPLPDGTFKINSIGRDRC